ncbi:MAG: CDP-diacylglycerol--glycerol-3-phosphate 3-phosphatidyltransferase [Verrucomicrobiales bacterium]|nr:CDP-diacylglycerol--glycerol-3-phosphate 3-phosphatidyltransferase [Verrucomicrobiales bacterium]
MTTANKITIFRILLVPFFIVQVLYYADAPNDAAREWYRLAALLTFALAALSDALDGYIARRYNQRSELGAMLDPLADKLLLVSAIVLLSRHDKPSLDRIPFWLTMTVIGRDVILLLGLIIIHYTCGVVKVKPHWIGKAATVFQMVLVLWILLKWPSNWLRIWVWGAGACTAVSGLLYVFEGTRQISASPVSAAAPQQDSSTPESTEK